jgi:hypothetical protein
VSLWLVWGFSGSLGVWQALVHNVGPHRLVTTYFLCGTQVELTLLLSVPVTSQGFSGSPVTTYGGAQVELTLLLSVPVTSLGVLRVPGCVAGTRP